MNRVVDWFHRRWLRHELANIATAIHHEEMRHRQHDERVGYWLAEMQRVRGELARLECRAPRLGSGLLAGRK